MEPELQKFYAVALVGLLAFFPVFNQVKDTSLEALKDGTSQGQWSSFFKSWDDIPPDERLDYWDGRSKPPGAGDDFDRGRVDDDARIDDGRGGPNGTDPDEDPEGNESDPNNETPPRYRLVETVLWEESFDGRLSDGEHDIEIEHDLVSLNFTWDYSGWTGEARFELYADESRTWNRAFGSPEMPMVAQNQNSKDTIGGTGTADLVIDWDYNPITTPTRFDVKLLGTYKEYLE